MYYQDAVFKELETLSGIPRTYIETGGLKIYTNLDVEAQAKLEESILNNVDDENEKKVNAANENDDNQEESLEEKYDREMDRRTRQNLERFAEFMARMIEKYGHKVLAEMERKEVLNVPR